MQIKSISINNFRSIENQTITDINNALILIGKNNSGKSSVITSIRAFFKQYSIEATDFPSNIEEIQIKITFEIQEKYLKNYVFDQKIGIWRYPSTSRDFESIKVGTSFSNIKFNEYTQKLNEVQNRINEVNDFEKEYSEISEFWLKSLKEKFKIEENLKTITARIKKSDLKITYDPDNDDIKLITTLFEVSYLHDERSFSEEEAGKTNTLTSDLFTNIIMNKNRTSKTKCSDCIQDSCYDCFSLIKNKEVEKLSTDDLEKLMQVKLKDISQEVSETISVYFQENYQKDYSIKITPQCNINKSVAGISTKIYDPYIQKELSISNVGAGLRNIYNLSLLQAYNKLYGNDSSKNRKSIYILEEPEIYLHPSLQKEMCSTIYDISQCNQVFFTTHSPLLLKNFDSTQIRKMSLNDKFKTEISNTSLSEVLNEIGYSTADLLQTEFVIICEGKDDKERIGKIIEKFYKIDLKSIFFIEAKSCSNIEAYATLKFLNKTELKDNFAIIRDSDTEEVEEIERKLLNKYKENLGNNLIEVVKKKILILRYSSLECYFLNPEIMSRIKVIKDVDTFYERINTYITDKRTEIEDYIKEHNDRKDDRISLLINEVYNTTDPKQKIEYIKKNVRGHNLFGIFGPQLNKKIHSYINQCKEEDFQEIIEFLNGLDYFNKRMKITKTFNSTIKQTTLFEKENWMVEL
jgi:putative ATP-dependent endonuclease of the OLD family